MFDWATATGCMCINNWKDSDTQEFESMLTSAGQVCIFLKSIDSINEENPYDAQQRKTKIISTLGKKEYIEGVNYIIIETPNIIGWYNA